MGLASFRTDAIDFVVGWWHTDRSKLACQCRAGDGPDFGCDSTLQCCSSHAKLHIWHGEDFGWGMHVFARVHNVGVSMCTAPLDSVNLVARFLKLRAPLIPAAAVLVMSTFPQSSGATAEILSI